MKVIDVCDRQIVVEGRFPSIARLGNEWYEDVQDVEKLIAELRESHRPDLFTFWQRLPDVTPRYDYHMEWDSIAALPVTDYEHWWKNQIKGRVRSMIRKASRQGVEAREAVWDDDFVRGITAIFNESPVRQGRPFLHYGKDVETVRREFSRCLFREDLIGAYYQGELIGFIMLADAGSYAVTSQIISAIAHRDKATNNVLVAKAVEMCVEKKFPYLVYLRWTEDSLSEFKRRCGFEPISVPRYYVPLTATGRLSLKLNLHRPWSNFLPRGMKDRLKRLRAQMYERKFSSQGSDGTK